MLDEKTVLRQTKGMGVFIVVALTDIQATETHLDNAIDGARTFLIREGVWLVDFEGTSRELSDKLGFAVAADGNVAHTGIVFPTNNYFGLAPPDIWEWLGSHMTRREG